MKRWAGAQNWQTTESLRSTRIHPPLTTQMQGRLEREQGQWHAQAEHALQAVVAAAPAPWRAEFQPMRELLGPDWPLHSAWSAALLSVAPSAGTKEATAP